MLSGYSFRPRAWALALTAVACVGGIALGNWQWRRAEEKRALGAQLERALREPAIDISAGKLSAEALAWKHVAARGRFVDARTVYLDNKLRRGRPGYEVVTPLRLNGMYVLVNRGWAPAGRTRDVLPQVPAPEGEVRIEGIALTRLPHVLSAGPEQGGKVRQNVELESFQRETGLPLQPIVIEQHSPAADGLLREWPRPDIGIEKHESYALQWYSLAGLAVVLLVVLSFARVRPS